MNFPMLRKDFFRTQRPQPGRQPEVIQFYIMSLPNELRPSLFRRAMPLLIAFFCSVLVVATGFAAEPAKSEPLPEAPITSADRLHWAFRPLKAPAVPAASTGPWSRNSIDHFVAVLREKKGLRPAAEASRAALVRRLTFDLTGVPPTDAEIASFCEDLRPDAYEQLVDRLLGSHLYGEKWGQHWLDLARFAETDGYEHDKVRSKAWQYRDWVISALDDDVPYDRFIALQIAGDELAPSDEQAALATGFCVAGPDMPDVNSQDERRHVLLNEITSTVGSALLGLQFGCAQCHDHKYDPISIGDFYRLRAWFEPAVSLVKDRSVTGLKTEIAKLPVSRIALRGDWRTPGPEVHPAYPRIADPWQDPVPSQVVQSISGRRAVLASWITRPDHPLTSRVIVNRLWQHHFGAGLSQSPSDFGLLGDEPHHVDLLDWLACELVRRGWSLKALHRLIVTSATYRQSTVAADDVPLGSNQQAETSRTIDPSNRYLSRFERRRLSGEEVRDAMFAASDSLNLSRGGPGVMPPLPQELSQNLLKNQWMESRNEQDHYRRSVYVFARRNLRYPVFEVFDRPDANASCPERNRSTTALQSLHLLNSQTSLNAARRLAGYILARRADQPPGDQIQLAFLRAIGREAKPEELSLLVEFFREQQQLLETEARTDDSLALPIPFDARVGSPYGAAFTDVCLAIFNLNEFLYVE